MLQELLTYAIEFVAIGGFGGILAHHIIQNCISVPVFRGRQAPQKPDVQSTLGFKPSQKTSDLLTTGSS